MNTSQFNGSRFLGLFSKVTGTICGIGCVVLISLWASRSGETFLGVASWKHNLFAWHPVLMVAGFFFSQAIAILSWGWPICVLPAKGCSPTLKKVSHVFWQTCAFACLGVAMYVIFKVKHDAGTSNLSSMHSWVGIAVASAFAFNFIVGLFFEGFKACASRGGSDSSMNGSVAFVRGVHKAVGLMAFGVTSLAILTGISTIQGFSCVRIVSSPDLDPAGHYDLMSNGCKISNGLGVAVIATVLLVFMSVISHYQLTDVAGKDTKKETGLNERPWHAGTHDEEEKERY
jgi:hypothetical protein